MKKICIDARIYDSKFGIGRYASNLISHLPPSNKYQIVSITKSIFHPYSLLAQLEIFIRLILINPHLLHVTHDGLPLLWFGPTIITVHDLTKLKNLSQAPTLLPIHYYRVKLFVYRMLLAHFLRLAKRIIVPSLYVKSELLKNFKLDSQKISVIYEGVDKLFYV
jgi:glycosyltransferase involved in cell wall biosynthesis